MGIRIPAVYFDLFQRQSIVNFTVEGCFEPGAEKRALPQQYYE